MKRLAFFLWFALLEQVCSPLGCRSAATSDDRGTLEGCVLESSAVQAWCDREHPLAAYCKLSPQPDYCVEAHAETDGTGDALYCCDPAGLR